ncbi:MAG: YgeY family selenium metabolism-linked hydrolase [Acidobacteria bacterium]|nr:MAG: YgeY family selenium metabolism-linked hydrolase [Acidobacteriota bacterium]
MMDRMNRIMQMVNQQKEELYQLIQDMVRIRSYSGEEGELVDFLIQTMQNFGFDEAYSDQLGNAVGRVGDGPVTILMDGHIDTVHVTENENWPYDPFAGTIVDGKIYGRGVVDEKSAVAGFIMAGKAIKQVDGQASLPFTLYIVGSVMEEDCDGYPLLHLIQREGIRPDYVVLGEPTDLTVYRGQRGRMEIKACIEGVSAHGAHNEQGDNAIYKMAEFVKALEKMDVNLPSVEPLGKGALTVSQISSQAPSLCSVADYCEVHIDRRLTIGETVETVLAELEQLAKDKGLQVHIRVPDYYGESWKKTSFTQKAYFPTWVLDQDHVLCRSALSVANQVLGVSKKSGFWKFSTNGVATAGRLGIPTIGFAPGLEELAHSDKEFIFLEDLLKATLFYARLPFDVVTRRKADRS